MINPLPTLRQNSIAFGHVLGDGYLRNGSLQVDQARAKLGYVKWLYNEFSNISGKLTEDVKRIHPKTGNESYSSRFYTKRCFSPLESIFYTKTQDGRKKGVPIMEELEKRFDAISLAIWFMDDGGKSQSTPNAAYINVSGFIESDRIKLQQALESIFALKTTLHKAGGNNQCNIYIPTNSYELFYELVYPTVSKVPGMAYKLGMPESESLQLTDSDIDAFD